MSPPFAPAHARLEVSNLACHRGGRPLFVGLSFTLGSGDAMVVRGPNGCGKSSLLRVLAGLLPAADGAVRTGDGHGAEALHYVGHSEPVKAELSVRENLAVLGSILGSPDIARGLEAFDLQPLAQVPGRQLSAGQRRRLSLARLLAVQRPIWLLDEPGVGLDAPSRTLLEREIEGHRAQGGIVMAATHGDIAIAKSMVLDLQP